MGAYEKMVTKMVTKEQKNSSDPDDHPLQLIEIKG
jgi:hypothetical protein